MKRLFGFVMIGVVHACTTRSGQLASFVQIDQEREFSDTLNVLFHSLGYLNDTRVSQNVRECADFNDDGEIDFTDFLNVLYERLGYITKKTSPLSIEQYMSYVARNDIVSYDPFGFGIVYVNKTSSFTVANKNARGTPFDADRLIPIASSGKSIGGLIFARAVHLGYFTTLTQEVNTLFSKLSYESMINVNTGKLQRKETIRDYLDEMRFHGSGNICNLRDVGVQEVCPSEWASNTSLWDRLDYFYENFHGKVSEDVGQYSYGSGSHIYSGYLLQKAVNTKDGTSKSLDEIVQDLMAPLGIRIHIIGAEHIRGNGQRFNDNVNDIVNANGMNLRFELSEELYEDIPESYSLGTAMATTLNSLGTIFKMVLNGGKHGNEEFIRTDLLLSLYKPTGSNEDTLRSGFGLLGGRTWESYNPQTMDDLFKIPMRWSGYLGGGWRMHNGRYIYIWSQSKDTYFNTLDMNFLELAV